ncbi:MAG TPA: DUF4388 domain-containing protein, partial [Polyangiales bacterium]|nr:DUF4388 domain-containing protein [Polyangiales bacterium]
RKRNEWADIPIIFLSSDVSVESKVQGLERGVEDYLTKPIYIKEIIARVNMVLQRKRREGLELKDQTSKQKFTGALSDIGVVDLLQTIDNSKKSGVLHLTSGVQRGALYFRNGNPVDAEIGGLRGARAIYRALVWVEGSFEIDFREVRREDVIQTSTQGVLMEGMRRLDEWGRLLEQLPDLDSVFEVNDQELLDRLAEIPDEINAILKHFDGERSLMQVVDACNQDDLETLTAISKLYFEGLVFNTGRHASVKSTAPEKKRLRTPPPQLATGNSHADELIPRAPSAVPPPTFSEEELEKAEKRTTLDYSPSENEKASVGALPRKGKRRRRGDDPTTLTGFQAEAPTSQAAVAPVPPTPPAAAPAAGNVIQFPRKEEASAPVPAPETTAASKIDALAQTVKAEPAPQVAAPEAPAPETKAEPSAPEEPAPAAASPLDEAEPTKLVRVKRNRKRVKRLSLTTSPGMLSSISPSDLLEEDDAPDPHEAITEDEGSLDDELERPTLREDGPSSVQRSSIAVLVDERQLTDANLDDGIRTMPPPLTIEAAAADAQRAGAGATRSGQADAHQTPPPPTVRFASTLRDNPPLVEQPHPSRAQTNNLVERTTLRPKADAMSMSMPLPLPQPPALEPDSVPPPPAKPAAATQPVGPIPVHSARPPESRWTQENTLRPPPASKKSLWIGLALVAGALLLWMMLMRSGATPASQKPAQPEPPPSAASEPAPTAKEPEPAPSAAPTPQPSAAAEPAGNPEPAPSVAAEPAPTAAEPAANPEPAPAAAAPTAPAASDSSALTPDVEALLGRARKLEDSKPKQALSLYEQAAQLVPTNSAVLSRLAFGYLNRGRSADAAEYAQRAVDRDPTNSEGWIVLGAAKHELGDRKAAKEAYRKCVEQGRGSYVEECRRMTR